MACMSRFSHEASEYDEQIQRQRHYLETKAQSSKPLTASEKKLLNELKDGKKIGWRIALDYVTNPPCAGTLTLTPEGYRAALSLIVPSLNVLMSKEDAIVWHSLTSGNGAYPSRNFF